MVARRAGAVGGLREAAASFYPPDPGDYARSEAAQRRLHQLVPGGAHTYARGSDQYPEGMAPVLVRGQGARVWDLDGREYVEYGMGLRSVTLGHAYRPVNQAVAEAISNGVNFSRPQLLELRAAETFLAQVPGSEMVKFAKNGSDATTAAVKLARAATGRQLVARCHDHPFFSSDDWFIASTSMPAGTLPDDARRSLGFGYNDLASAERLFEDHPGRIACVILEAATASDEPRDDFLERLRDLAHAHGSVLIFDEMITGMRWSLHGAQHVYGVTPDLSVWGKALGNGYAISALAGTRDLMELGGLRTDASRVFLLSTTHGPESVGLAAYLAVEHAYRSWDVVGTMEERGRALTAGVRELVTRYGLDDYVGVAGRPSCLVFWTHGPDGSPSQEYRTLFLQEMLRHGVLGQSFVISAAHTESDVEATLEAVDRTLPVYARAIDAGTTAGLLVGRPVAPALREYAAPRRLDHHGGHS